MKTTPVRRGICTSIADSKCIDSSLLAPVAALVLQYRAGGGALSFDINGIADLSALAAMAGKLLCLDYAQKDARWTANG